jgi:hypothetical protein
MIDKSVPSQFSSIKLDQLVYVELEARNGGMMLSVSEEGFAFRAVTSVRPSGRIPFSFIIHGTEKLAGYGEIKWTKDEGKVAGLQFTDVSTEFLNSLRKWLAEISSPAVASSAAARTDSPFHLDHDSRMESPKISPPEPLVETPRRSGFGRNFGQSLDSGTSQNEIAQASGREMSVGELPRSTWITSEWNYPDGLQADPGARGNGVVIAAVVACFLLLAILLYSFRETIGRSLISLGQKLSAPSETSQAQVSDTKPAEEAQPPAPANPSKEDNSASQSQATTSGGDKSEADRSQADHEKVVSPLTKTETPFRDERPASSAEDGAVKNVRSLSPAEEVRALWAEVGQGSTTAEVTLAKRYLIGGGVPKNCDQARVLLRAAAKKGNSEAITKLSQITRQGCP